MEEDVVLLSHLLALQLLFYVVSWQKKRWSQLLLVTLSVAPSIVLGYVPPEKVTFGGDPNYPPFEWLEHSKPKGFNIDLVNVIAGVGGVDADVRLADWAGTVRALRNGDVDVVPMFVSDERTQEFHFTTPFYFLNHAIYALGDTQPIYTVDELEGFSVAVEEGSFAQEQLSLEEIEVTQVPTAGTLDALTALTEGQAQYAVLAAPVADHLVELNKLPVKRLGPPFWSRGYAYAVTSDRADLRDWLQDVLDIAVATGQYQDIYDKWQVDLHPHHTSLSQLAKFGLLFIGILVLIIAGAVAWSWSLRRQVKGKTRDLQRALGRAVKAESRARQLADFDPNTGLAKPHHFAELVDEVLSREIDQPRELLIVKLIGLNEVIGSFGAPFAAALEQSVAQELSGLVKGPCGYFGQGVLATFSDKSEIQAVIKTLVAPADSDQLRARPVGGSAYYPEHGDSSSDLIVHAETALAFAQSSKKQWTTYRPDMEPDPFDLKIIEAFNEGLPSGLYPVYQPQICLATGNIVAAEALIRWNHPTLGFIGPDRFIPLVEKVGLVALVTDFVLEEAIRFSASLLQAGVTLGISVNISVYDLVSTDLVATIAKYLNKYSGRADCLKLELTETSFASDSTQIESVLHKLTAMGIKISIDDFGTGYSSLSYLSRFPVAELKIDRTFVYDMVTNERNRSIVRSTVLMSKQLGIRTVAEGVEEQAALDLLLQDGCDAAQGYLFSKGLPELEFWDYIAQFAEKRSG